MMIRELLAGFDQLRHLGAQPEMDPLTEADALQEAQLLDAWMDTVRGSLGLLFELRTALQLRAGNTGVLVAHGVRDLAWTSEPRPTTRTAWSVVASAPRAEAGLFDLAVDMWPKAHLRLVAASAAFFVVEVPGLSEAPPDYMESDDSVVWAQLPRWDSEFAPVHGVFLHPAAGTIP